MPKNKKPVSLKALERDGWKIVPADPYTTILKVMRVIQDKKDKEVRWEFDFSRDQMTGLIKRVTAKKVSKASPSSDDEAEGEGGWKTLLYEGPKKLSN